MKVKEGWRDNELTVKPFKFPTALTSSDLEQRLSLREGRCFFIKYIHDKICEFVS